MVKRILILFCLSILMSCSEKQDDFLIRTPIHLTQKNQITTLDFPILKREDAYAIYLIFSRPTYQQEHNPTAQQLEDGLSNIVSSYNQIKDYPLKPDANIHLIIELQDSLTGQMIFTKEIDFNHNTNNAPLELLFHNQKEYVVQMWATGLLKKGSYRLIVKNLNNSKAYTPYQVYLEVSKGYEFKH